MERDSFVFYRSFYEAIKDFEPESFKRIMAGICEYGLNSTSTELFGIENTVFTLIRPQLDANNKRFVNGQKGGAPEGNTNAAKSRDKLGNQYKTTNGGIENNQWLNKKQPNVNVNVNDNVNDNVNEKGSGEKQDVQATLDAKASRGNKKEIVAKDLYSRLQTLGLDEEIIDLAIVYDGCKKGKKLHKFDDKQLGIRVKKLKRCGFETIEGMKQVLENSIAGGYEGIFELKQKPISKPQTESEGKVVKVGGANIFF